MAPSTRTPPEGDGLPRPEVEVVAGADRTPIGSSPPGPALRRAVQKTLAVAGAAPGHVAVALVSAAEIRRLNREHRGIDAPTDVLSFPVDESGPSPGPREFGDVVICPDHTDEVERATVHGVLHLLGHDHETDDGRMLALEDATVRSLR